MIPEVDKIALLYLKNGKILSTKSKGKNKYYIPGGKREVGETDEQTLIREIWEELNVVILPQTIDFEVIFKAQSDGQKSGTIVKMTCYKAEFVGTPKPSNEIEEIRWLDSSHMPIISAVDQKIFNFLKTKGELI